MPEGRQDIGALWENFLVSERKKMLEYHQKWANNWFWRTKDQAEIDYVEEADGNLKSYEFKWNRQARLKVPRLFFKYLCRSEFSGYSPR